MTDTRSHDAMNWSRLPESYYGWGKRYFIDTEFSDFQAPEVLSIAIVGENWIEFYGERTDYIEARCSEFVRAVVVPQFGRFAGRAMMLDRLSQELRDWLARHDDDYLGCRSRPGLAVSLTASSYLLPFHLIWKYHVA